MIYENGREERDNMYAPVEIVDPMKIKRNYMEVIVESSEIEAKPTFKASRALKRSMNFSISQKQR